MWGEPLKGLLRATGPPAQGPVVRARVYRTTTTGQAWENLSPAIIVYLSPGSPDDGDMFRFLVPFHTRRGLFIMRIERAEGDKDPVCSSPTLRSSLAQLFRNFANTSQLYVLSCFCLDTAINFESRPIILISYYRGCRTNRWNNIFWGKNSLRFATNKSIPMGSILQWYLSKLFKKSKEYLYLQHFFHFICNIESYNKISCNIWLII